MLTVWTHLVSAESAASEKLQQVQIAVLEAAEAEASKEVIWNVGLRRRCVNAGKEYHSIYEETEKWLRRKCTNASPRPSAIQHCTRNPHSNWTILTVLAGLSFDCDMLRTS